MTLTHNPDTKAISTTACPFCDTPLPEQTGLAVHLRRDCPAMEGQR